MVFFLSRPKKDFFTPVEYIESSGTQYIDTGFKPNQDTGITMDIQPLEGGTFPYYGGRNELEDAAFALWNVQTNQIRFDYGTTMNTMNISSYTSRVLINVNKNSINYGNNTTSTAYTTFQSDYTMCLLGLKDSNGVDERQMSARLYSCKIYDNGVLVRDYIPAKDKNDVGGLFDKVNMEFVYSSGASQFAAGPEI